MSQYITEQGKHETARRIQQLLQLLQVTADGDLIDKTNRDDLIRMGLAQRVRGWNIITEKGLLLAQDLEYIHP